MESVTRKKNVPHYVGLGFGIAAIAMCIVTVALSVTDTYVSIYTLSIALILLGVNRIGLHLSNFKKNMFANIFLTAFIFILAILLALTKYSIYFLITTMFLYALTIIGNCLLNMRADRSIQSIIFNSLCITLSFLFTFVFLT